MHGLDTQNDPTVQVFTGDQRAWTTDTFVSHMFWTYGGVMDGTDMLEMRDDINAMLEGEMPKDGFCKEMFQTGSRFYHAGKNSPTVKQNTDYDYFGSPQMVGTWAIYLYLTGWELTSSPYFKGVYARHKNSTINLITVKRTEIIAWLEASAKTKSYIIAKEKETGSKVGKTDYLKVFKDTRNSVDLNADRGSREKELKKEFPVLNKLSLTVIKKQGIETKQTLESSVWGNTTSYAMNSGIPVTAPQSIAVMATSPAIF